MKCTNPNCGMGLVRDYKLTDEALAAIGRVS